MLKQTLILSRSKKAAYNKIISICSALENPVVCLLTTSFNIKDPHFDHTLYMCFMRLWEETALLPQQHSQLFCSENKVCFLWSTVTFNALIFTSFSALIYVAISKILRRRWKTSVWVLNTNGKIRTGEPRHVCRHLSQRHLLHQNNHMLCPGHTRHSEMKSYLLVWNALCRNFSSCLLFSLWDGFCARPQSCSVLLRNSFSA